MTIGTWKKFKNEKLCLKNLEINFGIKNDIKEIRKDFPGSKWFEEIERKFEDKKQG